MSLRVGLALTGMTPFDLFIAHVGLCGNLSLDEVERTVAGTRYPTEQEHDLLAWALNEQCSDLGFGHPVPAAVELGG